MNFIYGLSESACVLLCISRFKTAFFYPEKFIIIDEDDYRNLPAEDQKTCLSLPQVPVSGIHKKFFDFINNSVLRNKYLRLLRSAKDEEAESCSFWALLNSEHLTEEYRRFEEKYLIAFAKEWCQECGISCTDKPIDFWHRRREKRQD